MHSKLYKFLELNFLPAIANDHGIFQNIFKGFSIT